MSTIPDEDEKWYLAQAMFSDPDEVDTAVSLTRPPPPKVKKHQFWVSEHSAPSVTPRRCPFCKKSFSSSTYELHHANCPKRDPALISATQQFFRVSDHDRNSEYSAAYDTEDFGLDDDEDLQKKVAAAEDAQAQVEAAEAYVEACRSRRQRISEELKSAKSGDWQPVFTPSSRIGDVDEVASGLGGECGGASRNGEKTVTVSIAVFEQAKVRVTDELARATRRLERAQLKLDNIVDTMSERERDVLIEKLQSVFSTSRG